MALQKAEVDIPIASGIDEKNDSRLTGRLLSLVNRRQLKQGALDRRLGMTQQAYTQATGFTGETSNQYAHIDQKKLYSFGTTSIKQLAQQNSEDGDPQTFLVGNTSQWTYQSLPFWTGANAPVTMDVKVTDSNLLLAIWIDMYGNPATPGNDVKNVMIAIYDLESQCFVLGPVNAEANFTGASYSPTCFCDWTSVAGTNTATFVWRNATSLRFSQVNLNAATKTITAPANYTVSVGAITSLYNMVALRDASASFGGYALLYVDSAGGDLVIETTTTAFVFDSAVTIADAASTNPVAVGADVTYNSAGSAFRLHLVYHQGTGATPWIIRYTLYSIPSTLNAAAVIAPTTVFTEAYAGTLDGTSCYIKVDPTNTAQAIVLASQARELNEAAMVAVVLAINYGGASVAASSTSRNFHPYRISCYGKPVYYNSIWSALVQYGDSTAYTSNGLSLINGSVDATINPQQPILTDRFGWTGNTLVSSIAGLYQYPARLPINANRYVDENGIGCYAILYYETALASAPYPVNTSSPINDAAVSSIRLLVLRERQLEDYSSCSTITDAVVSHGPNNIQGAKAFDMGWWSPPRISLAAGAGTVAAGTYFYRACYVIHYPDGTIDRSIPSPSVSITLGAPGSVDVTVAGTGFTKKLTNTTSTGVGLQSFVEVYRSDASGSSTLRLVLTTPNLNAAPVTVNDAMIAADIASQPILYTISGELENVPPPAATIALERNSRIWLAGTHDDSIWYSKPVVPAGDSPSFNEGLTFPPFSGGRVTALAELDEKLIIFKENDIFYLTGDGPANNGAGATLSEPQRISSNVSAICQRGTISTEQGVFFQGNDDKIYLLDRSLTVQPVGEEIKDLTSGTLVTSACVVNDQNHVRFTTAKPTADPTVPKPTFVWDTMNGTWAKYQYYTWDSSQWVDTSTIVGSGKWGVGGELTEEYYTVLYSDGGLWYESTTNSREIASGGQTFTFPSQVTTGWLKLGGLQGFQRAYRVGFLLERIDDSTDITLAIRHDFQTGLSQSYARTQAQLLAIAEPVEYVVHIDYNNQKSQSIQLSMTDDQGAADGAGRGYRITGIKLQFGIKGGIVRVPAVQKG